MILVLRVRMEVLTCLLALTQTDITEVRFICIAPYTILIVLKLLYGVKLENSLSVMQEDMTIIQLQ